MSMILRYIRSILILVLISYPAVGQPDGGDPPPAPISGIEWLLLGGGIFGARKAYKKFKR